jgi:hypothetical protein
VVCGVVSFFVAAVAAATMFACGLARPASAAEAAAAATTAASTTPATRRLRAWRGPRKKLCILILPRSLEGDAIAQADWLSNRLSGCSPAHSSSIGKTA